MATFSRKINNSKRWQDEMKVGNVPMVYFVIGMILL